MSNKRNWNFKNSGGQNGSLVLPELAFYGVSGNGNANNVNLTLTAQRQDTGWSVNNNIVSFTGSPDRVIISANCFYDTGRNSSAFQRIAPILDLIKNGNATAVVRAASAYQRHTTNHFQSSNAIAFVDPNPGNNPTYLLRSNRGSSQTDVLPITVGHFSLEAIII